MPDLFDHIGALIGDHEGPIGFDLDGRESFTRDKTWIEENSDSLLILPETEDRDLLFVWAYLEDFDEAEIEDMRLAPTAVLVKGGDALVFWSLEEPVEITRRVEKLLNHINEDMLGGVPVAGAMDWEPLLVEPDNFHAFKKIEDAYGPRQVKKAQRVGEAVVHGKFDPDDERFDREIVVSVGADRECKKWQKKKITIAELIAIMSTHQVGKKDGPAIVLGELVNGRRVKTAVKAAYGIGLDVDVGMPGDEIDALLTKFGHLAIRHTTHSHGKSISSIRETDLTRWMKKSDYDVVDNDSVRAYLMEKGKLLPEIVENAEIVATEHREQGVMVDVAHAPIPKHRIIFPFREPFVIADQGGQEAALALFKKLPARLAGRIGAIPIDLAATDPSRLFYLPRHDKGSDYDSAIFGGPLLDWNNLVQLDPWEELAERMVTDEKAKGKTQTEAGKKLFEWAKRDACGFQLADLLRDYCEDKIRIDDGTKLTTECPFDELHSNPGDPDDVGFFVSNAGDGPVDSFVAHCQHDSCREFSILDFVGRMIEEEWFGKDALTDENYNILDHGEDEAGGDEDGNTSSHKVERVDYDDLPEDPAELIAIFDLLGQEQPTDWDYVELVLERYIEAGEGGSADKMKFVDVMKKNSLSRGVSTMFDGAKKAVQRRQKQKGVSTTDDGLFLMPREGMGDFREELALSIKALKSMNKKGIPQLVCKMEEPYKLMEGDHDEPPTYRALDKDDVWKLINERIVFTASTGDGDTRTVSCTTEVARMAFLSLYEHVPEAPEIITTPIFTEEGELLVEPGWYKDQGIFIPETDFHVDPVYEEPTWEEVEEAVDWIVNELLIDFPFLDTDPDGNEDSAPSRANAIAMLITPFMRRMIEGTTPLFLVNKPIPGTGGTFLGSLPMKLCDGVEPTPLHYSQSDEEMQKSLLSSVIEDRSHLFFDNITTFSSRVILVALTAKKIGGRKLGLSENLKVDNNFGWVATGNNPTLSQEMDRRTVRINLNAKTTNIQTRKFKHPPNFALTHRGKAVHCLLTMVQWWISQGKKRFKARSLASYEDWAEQVGGVLQACGIDGFLANPNIVSGDMAEVALYEFIQLWLDRWGVDEEVTALDLFQYALDNDVQYLSGNNEDQKRSRFMTRLPSLRGRLFEIGGRYLMIRESLNDHKLPVYSLVDETDAAQRDEEAA